jgi:C4-dicarboxylate transporter DctM subunit
MSTSVIGIIVLVLLLIMLFAGIKIGITLAVVGIVGVTLTSSFRIAVSLLGTTAFNAIKDYVFAVVPLFVLMGLFSSIAGAGEDLYNSANMLLKKVKGGMAMATVIANAIFAALTGASIASAAVFTKISLPEMTRLGYDKRFASGTIASSSVLGMLIPPSALMIIYGTITGESIGKLFIAGILPGILLSILYIISIGVVVRLKPHYIGQSSNPGNTASTVEVTESGQTETSWKTILKPWPVALLIILVLGGIWGGFFTPTEAGGIGAFGAMLLSILKGKFTWEKLWRALGDAGKTTGSILFLFIAAQVFSRMLAITGVISNVTSWIVSLGFAPLSIVVVFCILQIFMGCVLDSASIVLLTTPIMVPVIRQLGFDVIWYGIVLIVAAEIGLISPPFGISVFTVKSSLSETKIGSLITVEDIFKGSYSYLIMMIICLALIVAFPIIVTYLPSLMLAAP